MQGTWVLPLGQEDPLEKEMALIIRKEHTLKSAKGGNRKGKVREASKQEFYIMLRMCHPPNIMCDSKLEVVPICGVDLNFSFQA